MRVVLDTNILVSALLKPAGLESTILLLALRGRFELWVTPAILAEYAEVLGRPRLKIDPVASGAAMAAIRKVCHVVHPTRRLSISRDEPDNRFYECADAAQAHYLVTGNARHFRVRQGATEIVTTRQFIAASIARGD